LLYFIVNSILDFFFVGYGDIERNYSIVDVMIVTLIVAPLYETLIFQYLILKLPFRLFKLKKTKSNILILCIISSLFFGSQHYQNIGYMIFACIIGIYLAFTFAYVEFQSENKMNGYRLVAVIHFFINSIAFSLNYIV